MSHVKFALTNQKHSPDLVSDWSSVCNFRAVSQMSFHGETRGAHCKMSAVFSGYYGQSLTMNVHVKYGSVVLKT